MFHVIITSFNEQKSTLRAIRSFLDQKTKEELKITVVDPFPEVQKYIKKNVNNPKVDFFLDPGEGKSYALNLLIEQLYSKNQEDILIFTDGDVYVSENTLQTISEAFKDKKIGCVTGKPVPIEDKSTKYGFWAHLLFEGIHKTRISLSENKRFFECSGYLFAIRNGIITSFPLEVSEDSIIPYLLWKKGFQIKYLPEAQVYVKNPGNWQDWLAQKTRNIKGHENLNKIAPNLPRTKSFFNEIKYGWFYLFTFPKSAKEFFWTLELYLSRLYLYYLSFKEIIGKKTYKDGWRGQTTTDSTKTLD